MIIRVLPRDAMQSTVLLRQVVRPSVCLSVTLRYHDHMDWKSLKIISRSLSLGCLLSEDPNIKDLLQREHPEIFLPKVTHPVELSVADIQWQIVDEWLEIARWSQCRAYRKPTSLFPMV